MQTKDIYEIMKIILSSVKDKNFTWQLNSSANIKIQGIETSVQDLDIDTTDKGIDMRCS